jgi:hypothetical protein
MFGAKIMAACAKMGYIMQLLGTSIQENNATDRLKS